MYFSNMFLLVILIFNFVWIASAGGHGTILIKTHDHRKKGDVIVIDGGGDKEEEKEVIVKYKIIPVPMYMPKKKPPPIFIKVVQPAKEMPIKSFPIEAMHSKGIEAQFIEAMAHKGSAQPVHFAETIPFKGGKGVMPKYMQTIPIKGGEADWWRRK